MRRLTLTIILFVMAVGLAFVPNALAAGTLAGTTISNQAYADYKDANGNSLSRVFSNTVTTIVSRVAGVDIVPPTGSSTAAANATIDYLVQLFNTGNADDEQTFSYVSSGDWTPTSVSFYWDANNNHSYDAGTDVLLSETAPNTYKTVNGSGLPVPINPDDDYDVIMRVQVPNNLALDTKANTITITTKSDYDITKTKDGTYTTTVSTSAITATKTSSPAGPGSRTSKPGDIITYTIVMHNTGSSSGSALTFTDNIPAGMTYKAGSITVNSTPMGDSSTDGDAANYASGKVTVTAASIASGETITVTFQVTIDANLASGTPLENQGSIDYLPTGFLTPVTVETNACTFFVGNSAAVTMTTTAMPATGDPGDTITFPFTVTNNGNFSDTFEGSHVSSAGWTWAVWYDANNDGIAGNDGDVLMTDTDGDGKKDTGLIPSGSSMNLLIVATIPAGTTDGTIDNLSVTVYSFEDPTKTATVSFKTTVTAPMLSVVKAVSPTGSQPPGTVLTYTVTATNNGSGDATGVVITDMIPNYTTYSPGTIRTGTAIIGNTATLVIKTDSTADDGIGYDSGANAVIAGATGTLSLGGGTFLVLEFQVTID